MSHEAYLRNALSKYQYPDIAKRDVLNAFQAFKDLRPNVDAFVFNDGQRKELLCLTGTIPVSYKGSTYNIPLCIWLLDTHPYNPPMVFVKPTSTMQIKPGRSVDSNGRVYLPYLTEWKHPQSDLHGLIQILTIMFGEEPPVFSKNAAAASQPPRYAGYPPQPPLASQPYPGYPTQGAGMPMPQVNTSYPPATGVGYPPQQSYPGYPPMSAGGYPGYGARPPYPGQAGAYGAAAVSASSSHGLSDEQVRASLLSAVEDKMRRKLREIFAQAQAEMDALKKIQEDLTKGRQTLDDMIGRLEKEQGVVERNIAILREKCDEMQVALSKMENKDDVSIDDAIVPSAPLYKQILNAFAEEQATEDAIYYLGEALRRGVIDLDVFLKKVRELSRKQFMLRALVHKCRQKAGLPDLSQ